MKRHVFLIAIIFFISATYAYGTATPDTISKPSQPIKKGWNFGLLPVVSYDSDFGFQYGLLTNVYNYGDGSSFPKYKHSIYAEVSRYTKGSGIFRLFYDSEFVIPKVRFTADVVYLPDYAIDFYGFNGYESNYNPNLINNNSPEYISRVFYKHKRNIFRIKADFQGKFNFNNNFRWIAGYNFMNTQIGSVPIDILNKGKADAQKLPDVKGLYDYYVDYGIINPQEANGGMHNSIKLGFIYDTRDNEPCPTKGVWSEIVMFSSFSKHFNFGKFVFTHRQYFNIVDKYLSAALRLSYQDIMYGKAPFYLLPYMIYSYMPSSAVDGLGGGKTIRGMVRNRTVGDGIAYGNFEFRYKFVRFNFIKQNWYLALNPFIDAGLVVNKKEIDKSTLPLPFVNTFFSNKKENVHVTYGCGLRIAMNENFVIAADLGFPLKKEDGKMGIYIGMNWLF